MNKKKLFVLALVAVLTFTAACSDIVVKAFPTPYHRGYFTGNTDDPGTAVLPAWGGDISNCYADGLALPTWVDSADEFINFIVCKLNQPDSQSHVGAAFIISTMSGMQNINPGSTEINEFAARVRYAESRGWVNWHAPFECIAPNTYYQNNGPPDVAAYGSCGVSSEMVTFSRDGSGNRYIIKRICANPLGDMSPIPAPWDVVGGTTVTDSTNDPGDTPTNITTRPGDTLRFNHSITNNGPGVSYNWYALFGHPNATSFTGEYFNNLTLTGPPAMTRTDPGELKFDWGGGSPGGSVGADNFSVRWTKTEYLPAGTYGFNVVMDDGVRLYVDGNLIIDRWFDQGPTYYGSTVNLAEGNHTIRLEYYERGGGATAYLWYNMGVQGGVEAGYFNPGQTKNFPQDVRVPDNAPPDSKICRRILWDWKNSIGSGDFAPYGGTWGMGGAACATVTLPHKLRAAMSASPTTIQPGDGISFTPSISVTSNSTPIVVNCSINRTMISPTGTVSGLGAQPCVDSSGNANITIPIGGSVVLRANAYSSSDTIAIGSQVCDTITITNPSGASYYTNPSDQTAQACSTVAKAPYVQFMGGDVWAGGGFAAVAPGTCSNAAKITTVTRSRPLTADGVTPGSGTAYAAFALGKITTFGSGSMAQVTTTGVGDNWTFSNINTGNLGNFGAAQHCITDYVDTYQSSPTLAPGSIDIGCSDASCGGGGSGAWRITGDASLHGSLGVALKRVYLVSGNVTIDGDLRYPPTYSAAQQIPSLVVIATGNIYVSPSVRQMDGIFISRGTMYTCYPKIEPATTGTCSNQLRVTGSVSAMALDLFRTAGADGLTPITQKSAAEVFDLSPEVFLNNALNQSASTTITTSNLRELPPRF